MIVLGATENVQVPLPSSESELVVKKCNNEFCIFDRFKEISTEEYTSRMSRLYGFSSVELFHPKVCVRDLSDVGITALLVLSVPNLIKPNGLFETTNLVQSRSGHIKRYRKQFDLLHFNRMHGQTTVEVKVARVVRNKSKHEFSLLSDRAVWLSGNESWSVMFQHTKRSHSHVFILVAVFADGIRIWIMNSHAVYLESVDKTFGCGDNDQQFLFSSSRQNDWLRFEVNLDEVGQAIEAQHTELIESAKQNNRLSSSDIVVMPEDRQLEMVVIPEERQFDMEVDLFGGPSPLWVTSVRETAEIVARCGRMAPSVVSHVRKMRMENKLPLFSKDNNCDYVYEQEVGRSKIIQFQGYNGVHQKLPDVV
jgi:hypothetical protein